jgi:hypothetical protein
MVKALNLLRFFDLGRMRKVLVVALGRLVNGVAEDDGD